MNLDKIKRAVLRIVLNTRMILDDQEDVKETMMYQKEVKFHGNAMLKSLQKKFGDDQIEALFKGEGEAQVLAYWHAQDVVVDFLSSMELESFSYLASLLEDGKKKGSIKLEGVTFTCREEEIVCSDKV